MRDFEPPPAVLDGRLRWKNICLPLLVLAGLFCVVVAMSSPGIVVTWPFDGLFSRAEHKKLSPAEARGLLARWEFPGYYDNIKRAKESGYGSAWTIEFHDPKMETLNELGVRCGELSECRLSRIGSVTILSLATD